MREMEQVVLHDAYHGNVKALIVLIILSAIFMFIIWFREFVRGDKHDS